MQCRKCKNTVPDGSIFCNFCGEKLLKERRKKTDIKVPAPIQLPSGRWRIQLRKENWGTTEDTAELCIAKATAVRAGFVEAEKNRPTITLSAAIDAYIKERDAILSPSTIRGYRTIQHNRFKAYMNDNIYGISNWQSVINEEMEECSAKTLENAWGFVKSVLRKYNISVPELTMPQVVKNELPWLDYEQVLTFINAAKDADGETAALLALNGLRRSEVCGLRWNDVDIDDQTLLIRSAVVAGEDHRFIRKDTNKNPSSHRTVPIMIPRLQELLQAGKDKASKSDDPVIDCYPHTIGRRINRICESAGLPSVCTHGLRRSFASLAYHLGFNERETMDFGGWDDYKTMHDIYIKLAKADKKDAAQRMRDFYSNRP